MLMLTVYIYLAVSFQCTHMAERNLCKLLFASFTWQKNQVKQPSVQESLAETGFYFSGHRFHQKY